ncbi:MAG: bifunctional RNase H/acid phosphatase [Candidatus Nanopelagicaceae bacterium]
MSRVFRVTADGGSRGNPGPAAYGATVSENGKVIAELFEFIGTATNNVAEYSGLIAALHFVNKLDPAAEIEVAMDSKLVVEQMSGRWQIKNEGMRALAKTAIQAHDAKLVKYRWIPREENAHADRLANKALDERVDGYKPVVPANRLTARLREPEVPTFVYMIRHGETILTPDRKFSGIGKLNPPLTQEGRAQAAKVAAEIAKVKPDILISSPLQRTKDTADEIAKTTGLAPIYDEVWYECSFGDWDGLSVDEVKEKWPEDYISWISSSAFTPPGGESYDDLAARIEPAFDALAEKYPGQKVVIVTHNGVIKQLASIVLEGNPNSLFHIDVSPCSISSFSIWPSDGLRAVRSINERGHFR